MTIVRSGTILLALTVLSAAPAHGQRKFPPDSLTNVKVLPKTMPVRDVIGVMRGFTFALGVRCTYCHVGQENQPLESYDFTSDEKRPKQAARVMMQMVMDANRQLANVPSRPTPTLDIKCAMCHRGVARPVPIEDIVTQALASAGGLDSAQRAWRSLRERYYGRAAYDFGEPTLTGVAQALSAQKQWDNAIALLKLNEEGYPKSASLQSAFGVVYNQKGDSAQANARFRAALAIDPNDPVARRMLQPAGQRQ